MSIFNTIGKAQQMPFQSSQSPMNGLQNMVQRFNQFRSGFTGDANKQIQDILNSGKVTQSQYNQALQLAQQFRHMLGGR